MSQPQKPKIRFHETHGIDISISHKSTTARSAQTNHNGLVFISEPIRPFQKIAIKLVEVSDKYPTIISIGFTSHDPSAMRDDLPLKSRSELKIKQGFWICTPPKQCCVRDAVLQFYVSPSGNIHFGVNGVEKACFDKNVDTSGQLWGLVDIRSPLTAIEAHNSHPNVNAPKATIFHEFSSANVKVSANRVQKLDDDPGYVFVGAPLQLEKSVLVRFLSDGNLVLGVTSCDPSFLKLEDLPETPDGLFDRSEYWVVVDDPTWNFQRNDELSYLISTDGEMKIWKNSSLLLKKFHVDTTTKLWGFFVLGSGKKIEVTISGKNLAPSERKVEKQVRGDSRCVICCDNLIEVALYPCGHMCLCADCAKKQWRGGGDGHCPLCRVGIKDVMKVYRS
ncbi:hypothetical protein Zmor_015974 [Zophobas morio]|uniref:Protein neuralized n=1 Tax=Zophobas morio TaxID=2755281 RepID=A0AA38IL38_9CUCU|nr:hypothetical protein Zmor_015974 [Zophobas morio]